MIVPKGIAREGCQPSDSETQRSPATELKL